VKILPAGKSEQIFANIRSVAASAFSHMTGAILKGLKINLKGEYFKNLSKNKSLKMKNDKIR